MTVKILGTILAVREGKSKTTGKSYTVADVYDGYNVIRVFNASLAYQPGEIVEIKSFLRVDENGRLFCSACKEQ